MGMKVLQNLQNCRVGYENHTKVTELSGKGMKVLQNSENCRVGYDNYIEHPPGISIEAYLIPGYTHGVRTDLQNYRVRV